jgi:molybdopterin-containing oxidoreductase family iron-sulfur binding subunit
MHCENPPCVSVCPKKARISWKDGLVLTDVDLCEGVRVCESACPYGANYFNVDEPKDAQYLDWDNADSKLEGMWPTWSPELSKEYNWDADPEKKANRRIAGSGYRKNTVGKCTFCVHRLEAGNTTTACQQACPAHAITFGDLDDATSEVSKAITAAGSKVFKLKESAGTKPKVVYLGEAPAANAVPVELVPLKKDVQKNGTPELKNGTIPWK